MIKFLVYLSILAFSPSIWLQGQVPARWDCPLARDQFAQINDRLLNSRNPTAEHDPKALKAGTQSLEDFITRITLARLSDIGDAEAIRSYLSCMQERERPWDDLTDAPKVFVEKDGQPELAVMAMLLMRGGDGIPDTRAVVQCFAKDGPNWVHIGDLIDADAFDRHMLHVFPLQSPIPSEAWYLLSGRAIGDTGGHLRLEVVSCTAKLFKTVWVRDGILWGDVDVRATDVTLSYERRADPNHPLPASQLVGPGSIIYEQGSSDPLRFSDALRVTKNGLEP